MSGARDPTARAALAPGLAALAKSVLVLVGVPAALVRLSLLVAPHTGLLGGGPARLAARAALALAAVGWLTGASRLGAALLAALARRDLEPSSWSSRWALRLAALVLMLGAGLGARATARRAAPVPGPAVAHGLARPGSGPQTSPVHPSANRDDRAPLVALGLGVLLAAALARRARLLRRVAACVRGPGERQPPPSPARRDLAAFLAPSGGEVLLDWVEAANRLLWSSLAAAPPGTPAPPVGLVRVGPDGVELRLRHPCPDPLPGFVALEGGAWWSLEPTLGLDELEARTAGCGRLLPALLPIGSDGTAAYLLELGPTRRLALEGDPATVERSLAALVLALRVLPWADELEVELLGIEPPPAEEACYQLSASSPEELAVLAASAPETTGERVAAPWQRQLLVVSALVGDDPLEALLERCRQRAGVLSRGGAGTEALVVGPSGAVLEPLGLCLEVASPSPEVLAATEQLLAEASAPPRPAPRPEPRRAPPAGPPEASSRGAVEVRLLDGPAHLVGATGAVAARDLARVVELVAYLALHDHGADATRLAGEIFGSTVPGDEPATHGRLDRLAAAARTALGPGPDGHRLVWRDGDGRVHLAPGVTCDATRLVAEAAQACDEGPEQAERLLRHALGLVGRAPLPEAAAYAWLVAAGQREALLATIVDAAHHLALLALARGDAGLAAWAIERGRRAEPCSELLARDLMLACDALGDSAGTEQAFLALEDGLARLGGNEPSEATRELHAALTRRTGQAGRPGR